jgi:hypothetical protein
MDDEVLKQEMMGLNQVGKISTTTLFETFGIDFNKEQERLKEEAVSLSRNQIETKFEVEQGEILTGKDINAKIGEQGGDYKKILDEAQGYAEQLYGADEGTSRSTLHQLKMNSYPLYLMVSKLLEEYKTSPEHQATLQQNAGAIGEQNAGAIKGGAEAQQAEQQDQQQPQQPQ